METSSAKRVEDVASLGSFCVLERRCLAVQVKAKEYDLADKNGLADFLEHANIQLVPRARGRVMQTPNPAKWDGACSIAAGGVKSTPRVTRGFYVARRSGGDRGKSTGQDLKGFGAKLQFSGRPETENN